MYRKDLKYFFSFLICFASCTLFSQSAGGTTSGAASYCSAVNTGFVSVTGYTGSVLNWESSVNGGITWLNIGNPTANQSYFNLTQSTCYRAVVKNGAFPADTSTVVCITIYSPTVPGSVSGGGTFCGGTGPGSVTLSGNNGSVLNWLYSTDSGATWNIIANTSTVLTYTNIGNDIVFEAVVQNSSFCAVDTSGSVVFNIDPVSVAGTINLSGNDSVCSGLNSGTFTLSGNTGAVTEWISSKDSGITWTAIANTTTIQNFSNLGQTTLYEAIIKSGICPADTSNNVSVTVMPLPLINAGADSSIMPGRTITLNGSGTGTPVWSPSAGLSSIVTFTTIATPTVTTNYILTTSSSFGCVNSDTVLITVILPNFNGTISNYFTPNGDGINDAWYIEDIQNYPSNEVSVFNIYGNEVYTKKNYMNDWKGTYNGAELPDGTYYYVLRFDNSNKVLKGSVDIIKKK
jgi:gliding motility-associated-like protein